MRYLLIFILASIFLLFGCPNYLFEHNLLVALTYQFFHVNIFHLIGNCLSLWYLFRRTPSRTTSRLLRELCIGLIIATISYGVATMPVVGISNMLFAIMGLRTPPFSSPWWKASSTKTFFIITLLMILVPKISAITHIAAFVIGVLVSAACRTFRNLSDDYKHATYK